MMIKKSILCFMLFLTFCSLGFASSSLEESILRMNKNGLTKFDNSKDFMFEKKLRRDEATKFFGQYATQVQKIITNEEKVECSKFTDLNQGRPDLQNNMKMSCNLGLFKGNKGKFMPTNLLTNGQAITVLIRMIDGSKDESKGHFATKYFEKAESLGLTQGLSINTNTFENLTTRGEVAILLFRAYQLQINKEIDTIIKDSGTKITKSLYLKEGLNKFQLTNNGESNFIVELIDNNGSYVSLLANEIGSADLSIGSKIDKAGDYYFNIKSDGNRSINTTYDTPRVNIMNSEITGKGKNIIGPFNLTSGLHKFQLTNNGESNFIVELIDNNGNYVSLLANEIGSADLSIGSKINKAGDYYFNIKSDGNRSIKEYK